MTIIVEDGSIVANANSFATRAELISFALLRGSIIADTDSADVLLIKASDYIEGIGIKMKGVKTDPSNQSLQYPRYGVVVDGYSISSNAIPSAFKTAFLMLALESFKGLSLQPSSIGMGVVVDKTGPLSTTYSERDGSRSFPTIPAVDAYLNRFLDSSMSVLQMVKR